MMGAMGTPTPNRDPSLSIRVARLADLRAITALLAEDAIGDHPEPGRESPTSAQRAAFAAIAADPRNLLLVADLGDEVVGTCQVTFIPYLTHGGSERAHLESVRVASRHRGAGVGRQMMEWVIEGSRRRGCRLVQLTTNWQRLRAKGFYERLGFVASHRGMKLHLD
jgi:GNAT superfamily N-acetyltransferase